MVEKRFESVSSITSGVVDATATATSPMIRIDARIVLDMSSVSTVGLGGTDFCWSRRWMTLNDLLVLQEVGG
jgi:hypothetical protein